MNIAFFCIPAHGHTNPTLAVVRELTARGHTVRYYTTEAFRAKVEAAGAAFVPFDAEAARPGMTAADGARLGSDLAFSTKLIVDLTLAADDWLSRELTAHRPDVIVGDSMAFWAKLAAKKHGIPFVSSTTTFAFNRFSAKVIGQNGAGFLQFLLAQPRINRQLKRLRAAGYAVKSVFDIIANDNETETVVYTSPDFQPCADTFSEKYHFVDRLLREFKVEANVGAPQVAYKETITKAVDQDTKYARQSGGKGQYGHVKIHVEPNESGKGYEFVNATVGGSVPKEYIPAVDAGIQGAMLAGVLAGYPVVDVKVTLYDGSYHEVDSSEMAFKIAGSMAFKEACQKAGPTLLEPIMKVSVIVPDEYMGDVIGDLNSRRGQIQGFEARSGAQQIDAFVPLAEMFGYATDLRSRTQGRGQYTMEPSHYIEIPKSIQEKIIDQRTGRHMS